MFLIQNSQQNLIDLIALFDCIVISAFINALVVRPLVRYADAQYKITEDVFILARDLTKDLIKDPINTIEDFDPVENAQQLKEYAIDYVENVGKFGFIAAAKPQKQSSGLFLAINENSAMPNLGREPSSSALARRKAAKRFDTNSVYFLKTKEEAFTNDNFKNYDFKKLKIIKL